MSSAALPSSELPRYQPTPIRNIPTKEVKTESIFTTIEKVCVLFCSIFLGGLIALAIMFDFIPFIPGAILGGCYVTFGIVSYCTRLLDPS